MEWIEVFVATSQMGLEPVEGVLYQCGLNGLMIHDEADFAEFLENPNREWDYVADELVEEKQEQTTGITFFLRDNLYGREQLSQIKSALQSVKETEKELDLGSLEVTMKNVAEEDWANNWKKYFKPFPVGDKIMIKPSWEELPAQTDKIILKIDPGHIFGTGTHETTQLCMELIEKYVKKDDMVLDIGCGSGILSIASLLLDAKEADAVDIDPNAIQIAYENSNRNDIDRNRYHVKAGNILEDKELQASYSGKKYDLVAANIVADVIIALTKQVPDYIKDDGIFLCSGIITERKEDVLEALKAANFAVLDIKEKTSWVAIATRYEG
ncbi:50S ribosomal protein L11 methyltransferase [Anaerotignum lactatifermentans]|uniref:50S ribosomal protein L11 methyltransferase n=1 Tax=Anaerotignum lactatifermentans TaxID=160404 RepID=UPI0030792F9B